MAKLFAKAYAVFSTRRFTVVLYTESDIKIEALRAHLMDEFSKKKLLDFLKSAKFGDKIETRHQEYICVSTEYTGDKYVYFNNLPEAHYDKYLEQGDITV